MYAVSLDQEEVWDGSECWRRSPEWERGLAAAVHGMMLIMIVNARAEAATNAPAPARLTGTAVTEIETQQHFEDEPENTEAWEERLGSRSWRRHHSCRGPRRG